jgi:hypothetical protein
MTDLYGDAVVACADLVGRAGASQFEIGYLHDDVPVEDAGWYASAFYCGARITVDDQSSPTLAAFGLAERLLRGGMCRCGRRVSLGLSEGCRWSLVGQRWEPGCDAQAIHVEGERGDHAAMVQALSKQAGNRAQRRRARRAT